MARRFGKFNKNQKRDGKGRWTKGGGSAKGKSTAKGKPRVKSSAKKPDYATGRLSNGSYLYTTQDPNKFGKAGTKAGGVLGAAIGATVGQPFAGAGVGILAGGVVGNTIDRRISIRRINAAEAALRRKR